MQKEPLLPPLTGGEGLGAELGRGTMLGRGEGEMVVVGRGKKGGCNSRIEEGGVVSEEVKGGHVGWYGKKPKGDGNGNGKNPGN